MTQDFDAYYKWLGIPPAHQPPDHYRLLGIQQFEEDLDVIESAADGRLAHLRSYQSGKRQKICQQLLNKIASARVCLLNPQQRAEYDRQLRESQATSDVATTPRHAEPPMVAMRTPAVPLQPVQAEDVFATDFAASEGATSSTASTFAKQPAVRTVRQSVDRPKPNYVVAGVVAGALCLLIAGMLLLLMVGYAFLRMSVPVAESTIPAAPPAPVLPRPETPSVPVESEPTAVSLFNGKDLTGWNYIPVAYSKSKTNKTWRVDVKGNLISTGGNDSNDLGTAESFSDFKLSLQWRFRFGGPVFPNGSGIIVRSRGMDNRRHNPRGIEIDLRPNQDLQKDIGTGCLLAYATRLRNHTGVANGEDQRRLGWLRQPILKQDGGWNDCTITCQGENLEVTMNGMVVNRASGVEIPEGIIVLRNQKTAVEFRNIELTKLSSN